LHDRKCSEKCHYHCLEKRCKLKVSNSDWTPSRCTLSPELLNETKGRESWKKKKRNVLGESKFFKKHTPQTYWKIFKGYYRGSLRTMFIQFSTKDIVRCSCFQTSKQTQPPFLTRFSASLNSIQRTCKIHGCLGKGPESKM